jgi:2-aminoadipate transaminase
VLSEAAEHAGSQRRVALSVGYPSSEQIPVAELALATEQTLAGAALESFEYCPIEGTDELRAQLATLGRARGLDDEADSILITTGGRQGLTVAARAVLRAGDVVACESPTYMGMLEALRATGASVMPIGVDEHGFDVEALERLLRGREVKLVALQPRGHNPTGRDPSDELACWSSRAGTASSCSRTPCTPTCATTAPTRARCARATLRT